MAEWNRNQENLREYLVKRYEELISSRVDDIDWSRGIITIRPETTKNGRMRQFPLSPRVSTWLS